MNLQFSLAYGVSFVGFRLENCWKEFKRVHLLNFAKFYFIALIVYWFLSFLIILYFYLLFTFFDCKFVHFMMEQIKVQGYVLSVIFI